MTAKRPSGPTRSRAQRRADGEVCIEVWLDPAAQCALAKFRKRSKLPAAAVLRALLINATDGALDCPF